MKKALLTLYVLFRILLVEGSHINSELLVTLQNGAHFTASLDNNYYNQPVQSLHLSHVAPGKHLLRINELRYNSWMNNWYDVVVFNGYVDIPVATRVSALIDNSGRFVVTQLIPLIPAPVVHYNNYHGSHHYYGMTPATLSNLQNIINNQSFDSAKLKIAKQAIAANKIRSEQVLQLMNLFTFESYKLDLAKFAYQHTIDKQNYFMLYDGFTFQSSINNLARHIGQTDPYAWN